MATHGGGPLGTRFTPTIVLLLGLLLIALAAPRLVAAIIALPADRVAFHLRQGATVTEEALRGLITARHAALALHETAQGHREIAAAELELAHRARDAGRLQGAERTVRRALSLAPADPYSWARLAHLSWVQARDAPKAFAALRASLRVGSFEPTLAPWRARLMLRLWPQASPDDRAALAVQIRQLAQHQPEVLAAITTDPAAAQVVAELLGETRPGSRRGP